MFAEMAPATNAPFTMSVAVNSFLATRIHAEGQDWPLDEVYLQPSDQRPPLVSELRSTTVSNASREPIAQRWSTLMRDCKLGGYHPMVILSRESPEADQFVSDHLTNYRNNPLVAKFMTLTYRPEPADADFRSVSLISSLAD